MYCFTLRALLMSNLVGWWYHPKGPHSFAGCWSSSSTIFLMTFYPDSCNNSQWNGSSAFIFLRMNRSNFSSFMKSLLSWLCTHANLAPFFALFRRWASTTSPDSSNCNHWDYWFLREAQGEIAVSNALAIGDSTCVDFWSLDFWLFMAWSIVSWSWSALSFTSSSWVCNSTILRWFSPSTKICKVCFL